MTEKMFMEKVAASNSDAEMVAFAKARLAKIAEKNEKAKSARIAKAESDKPLMDGIVEYLASNGEILASVLAEKLGVSCPKICAVCLKLENAGIITSRRVRVPKIGERTVYKVAKTETEVASN